MDTQRLQLSAEAEKEFLKNVAIVDYAETKRILEAVNNVILTGVKVNEVVYTLNTMAKLERMKL